MEKVAAYACENIGSLLKKKKKRKNWIEFNLIHMLWHILSCSTPVVRLKQAFSRDRKLAFEAGICCATEQITQTRRPD